jgi:signal transduction histidine kinase
MGDPRTAPPARRKSRSPQFVSGGYALFGYLWILFSDRLVQQLLPGVSWVQTWKGWFFVTVTALALLAVLRRLDTRAREQQAQQRALEERLRKAQRLEALGLLVGGVAHDFNNHLQVILANLESLAPALEAGPEQPRQDLRDIQVAATRSALMVRKLLSISRNSELQPRALELGAQLREMFPRLRRVLAAAPDAGPGAIDAQLAPPLDGAAVWASADPAALEEVLLNLFTNARDAMPGGGKLTVRLGAARELPAREGLAAGLYVALEVRDTGTGMDEATRARLFEPFFTTKAQGRGTGLGLAMGYGILRQLGGGIEVESRPGEGTAFTLLLPAASPAPSAAPKLAASPLGRGRGRVLLVEDEEAVRRAAERVLTKQGYTVQVARDGQEALELLRASGFDVELVLSDLRMPRLDGLALHAALQKERPGLPFLLVSGYGAAAEGAGPGLPVLAKPWTPAELLRRVGELVVAPAA